MTRVYLGIGSPGPPGPGGPIGPVGPNGLPGVALWKGIYNPATSYALGEGVDAGNGTLFISNENANLGNAPATHNTRNGSGTQWSPYDYWPTVFRPEDYGAGLTADDDGAFSAMFAALAAANGGTIELGGKNAVYNFPAGLSADLPRVSGRILWHGQGATVNCAGNTALLRCTVPRAIADDAAAQALLEQCVGWEFLDTNFAGAGGRAAIWLEAGKSPRIDGCAFTGFKRGHELRFMLFADVGANNSYTNCTEAGALYANLQRTSHTLVAGVDVSLSTIPLTTTLGFEDSGEVIFGGVTTVSYTSRDGSNLFGCVVVSGATTVFAAGERYYQPVCGNVSLADGCNRSHHGGTEHYGGTGEEANVAVLGSDSVVVAETSHEGHNPKWWVYFDHAGLSTVNNFSVDRPRGEGTPSIGAVRYCGQGRFQMNDAYFQGAGYPFVDTRGCLATTNVHLSRCLGPPYMLGDGSANVVYHFDSTGREAAGGGFTGDWRDASHWIGGVVPPAANIQFDLVFWGLFRPDGVLTTAVYSSLDPASTAQMSFLPSNVITFHGDEWGVFTKHAGQIPHLADATGDLTVLASRVNALRDYLVDFGFMAP